jgi:hypothetical protein
MPEVAKKEPNVLWSNRLRAHAQKDLDFMVEARKRAGRIVPDAWQKEVQTQIETAHTGKVGRDTGRSKEKYLAPKVRVSVPQTRTVGVGQADRDAVAKAGNHAFDRLKSEATTARVEKAMEKAESGRKSFSKPQAYVSAK